MNYQEAERYILSFTDYEKAPAALSEANYDLRRVEALLARLGNPHTQSKAVHIAGTKGKGSIAAMIASVLHFSGRRTGLYTSPHLHTIRERLQVDGEAISEEELAREVEEMKPQVEAVNRDGRYGLLTTFEVLTTLAFLHFARKGVDYQVLEVGLGGRLDATNVVKPEVSVISSLSYDHVLILGHTLPQIAREKAGIIKPVVPVVSSPQLAEALAVIEEVCQKKGAPLTLVGRDITWHPGSYDLSGQSLEVTGRKGRYPIWIPLLGDHQMENVAAAVAALELLGLEGKRIAGGLTRVRWPGRMEVLRQSPFLVVDGAHNAESAGRLREAARKYFPSSPRTILIVGTSADKDIPGMARELAPICSLSIVTRSRHPRSALTSTIAEEFRQWQVPVVEEATVPLAVERALALAGPHDLVLATGSLFLVAEVIEYEKVMNSKSSPFLTEAV